MWIGAQTSGHGHHEPYGRFHDAGTKHLAHRWSAEKIHGFEITGLHVDHCCPAGPSTLCVEHVRPETAQVNRALQHLRPGRAFQSLETRRYWLFVQKGIEPAPQRILQSDDVPFFHPPAWLRPYLPKEEIPDDCPF